MSLAVANIKVATSEVTTSGKASSSTPMTASQNGHKLMFQEPLSVLSEKRNYAVLTPRTEASTPGSRVGDIDDDIVETLGTHRTIKQPSKEEAAALLEDDTDTMPMSQISYNDQHIRQLHESGELDQVAGSQSILSQELMYDLKRSEQPNNDENNNESSQIEDDKSAALGSLRFSQETAEGSVGFAKRIGLLSMTQEEEVDNRAEEPSTPKRLEGTDSIFSLPLGSFSAKKEMIAAENNPRIQISDSCIRESEGFGSLLDAVAKITEQEESEEGDDAMLWRRGSYAQKIQSAIPASSSSSSSHSPTSSSRHNRKSSISKSSLSPTRKSPRKPHVQRKNLPMASTVAYTATSKRKTTTPTAGSPKKAKHEYLEPFAGSAVTTVPNRKKKEEKESEDHKAAIRAAALAERIVTDPFLAKRLLLSMALVRENPRNAPDELPGPGHVLVEGFVWAQYPPLEHVLKDHMAQYYELSTTKCQSAQQQTFNNEMVGVVKEVADERKWKFAECFTDKSLRDRIRCYYKTHIQNAKKRLRTMVRNPTKRANARHLLQHLNIIEKHNEVVETLDIG